jgi:hypothetical protein
MARAARWKVAPSGADAVAAMALLAAASWPIALLAGLLVDRLSGPWDGVRLAPAFAMARGYPIYPDAGEGPLLGYSYGPVSVLAYLPAVLAPGPTTALLGAGALTLAWAFGPVLALLIRGVPRGPSRRVAVAVGLIVFAVLVIRSEPMRYSTMSPIHDAMALGLGLLACVALVWREGSEIRQLAVSASLTVLAAWAKQTAVFLVPALALYCLLTRGRKAAALYVALVAGLGTASALLWAAIFGVRPLVHYLILVQAGLPIPRDRKAFVAMGNELEQLAEFPLIVLAVAAGGRAVALRIESALRARNASTPHAMPPGIPWGLPLLVAAANVPIAVLGALKYGGGPNSLSYTLYYLDAAAALAVAGACAPSPGARPGPIRWAAAALALAGACVTLDSLREKPGSIIFRSEDVQRRLREHPNRVAFEYLKCHPGTAYFPWNPLAHLMAEGRLYSVEDAIVNVPPPRRGGAEPDFVAFLPRDPEFVAYPPDTTWGRLAALRFFPSYEHQQDPGDLPGFAVYRRPKPEVGGRSPLLQREAPDP